MSVNLRCFVSVLVVTIFMAANLWPGPDVLTVSNGQINGQMPVFGLWCDQDVSSAFQYLEPTSDSQVINEHFLTGIKINRASQIMRTYHTHNRLHFNIPLTCCKFSISQYTCGG